MCIITVKQFPICGHQSLVKVNSSCIAGWDCNKNICIGNALQPEIVIVRDEALCETCYKIEFNNIQLEYDQIIKSMERRAEIWMEMANRNWKPQTMLSWVYETRKAAKVLEDDRNSQLGQFMHVMKQL